MDQGSRDQTLKWTPRKVAQRGSAKTGAEAVSTKRRLVTVVMADMERENQPHGSKRTREDLEPASFEIPELWHY